MQRTFPIFIVFVFVFVLVLSFREYFFSGPSNEPRTPSSFEAGLTEIGRDGTVCEQSEFSERFLACISFKFYDVSGDTRSQVYHELATIGPVEGHATTVSDITASKDNEGRCMIMVFSKITLPNHANLEELSPELQGKWKSALQSLKEHELQHHKIALDESWSEFRNDCKTAKGLIDRVNGLNKEFDRETRTNALHSVEF